MAALRRVHSSGFTPPATLIAHRGAFIALGAVGISLGAVYAWSRSKRPAHEPPSSVLVPKKKPSKDKRSRGKRQKSRQQPANASMHESSEEDLPAAAEEELPVRPTHEATEETAAAAVSAPQVDLMSAREEVENASSQANTEEQWIPVERKQRKGRRAASAPAPDAPVSEAPAAQPPAADTAEARPSEVLPTQIEAMQEMEAPAAAPVDATEEARRLRREAKKKRRAEQAAAKAELPPSSAGGGSHSGTAAVGSLPRFAPPRSSWADDVDDDEENAPPATYPMDDASCEAKQVAAQLDAAEQNAIAAEQEAPVEWVEVKKRGGRNKK